MKLKLNYRIGGEKWETTQFSKTVEAEFSLPTSCDIVVWTLANGLTTENRGGTRDTARIMRILLHIEASDHLSIVACAVRWAPSVGGPGMQVKGRRARGVIIL